MEFEEEDNIDLERVGDEDWLVRAAEAAVGGRPDPLRDDRDDNSFEDSERFEEDSLCSWMSNESLTTTQTWRGWAGVTRQRSSNNITTEEALSPVPCQSNRLSALSGRYSAASSTHTLIHSSNYKSKGSSPRTLKDMAAHACAKQRSFDQLEEQYEAICLNRGEDPGVIIPPDLFIAIIKRCFPQNEDDIRLYSCLANGNAEEYSRGDALFRGDRVLDPVQIGFILSGVVTCSISSDERFGHLPVGQNRSQYTVSAQIDRCRIVNVECSCSSKTHWCQHAVALCLHRIHRASKVMYRVTMSDSIGSLDIVKLRKLAQSLVNELPRQYLPVAQKLIDELNSKHSLINMANGVPDATLGIREQVAIWALDPRVLHDNIRKILSKFCIPAPQVHCDVHLLSSTQPPIASEWTSLLRPFRSKEPEGLWNLLLIVREMYRRRDENATTLLHIITEECLASIQVLMWWYLTKLSQTGRWVLLGSAKGSAILSNQHTAQFNCSELCDEIVRLWKYAALNPRLAHCERQQLAAFLQLFHRTACERIWKVLATVPHVTTEGGAQQHAAGLLLSQMVGEQGVRLSAETARFTRLLFPAFFDALEACQVGWHEVHMDGVECGDRDFLGAVQGALSVDVDIGESAEGASSPNMPFLRGKHKVSKAYNPPMVTMTSSFSVMPPFYPMEMVQPPPVHKKKKKKRRHGVVSGSARTFSENYLPEFFDPRSLRQAARESARRAARQYEQAQEESTESGQESDFPPSSTAVPVEEEPGTSGVSHGAQFPQEDVNLLLASAHASVEGLELKFARCEALYVHGYTRQAAERALVLVSYLRSHPPDLCPPSSLYQYLRQTERTKGIATVEEHRAALDVKKRRAPSASRGGCVLPQHELAACHISPLSQDSRLVAVSERTIKTFERALLLAQCLSDPPHQRSLFSFILYVLELPRAPMATRYLEVKLYYLEFELISILRGVELGPSELSFIRERALRLSRSAKCSLVPPVALAHYILDALSYTHNMFPDGVNCGASTSKNIGRRPSDDDIALSAALEVLGAKQIFSEEDCPMLAESIRRQRGELAITLITRHKDSNEILGLILDKLLDPFVHKMYKRHGSNACYFLERDIAYQRHCPKGSRPQYPYHVDEIDVTIGEQPSSSFVYRSSSHQSSESAFGDSRCSEGNGDAADDEMEEITQRIQRLESGRRISEDSRSASTSAGSNSPEQLACSSSRSVSSTASLSFFADANESDQSTLLLDDLLKKRRTVHALYANGGGRPTEAAAHFYTELAKRVLAEAGGSQSTVMFSTQHPQNNLQHGPHRMLHIVSFLIGVYALGLNNLVNSTWPTRTYSTHVSWITGQTLEIGVAALEILRETWPSHLIPTEVAQIADKASKSRDASTIAEAALLAVSVLNSAHALTVAECEQALRQCKEHSSQLLEQACNAVEQASESGDGVYPEVLFRVAHLWQELQGDAEGAPQQVSSNVPPPHSVSSYMPAASVYQQYQQFMGLDLGEQYPMYGFHPAVPPPPFFSSGQPHSHRPHSVYIPPPLPQYGGASSLAVGDEGGSRLAPPIHQSHSAPNLNPSPHQQPYQLTPVTPVSFSRRGNDVAPAGGGPLTDQRFVRLKNAHRVGMRALETMGNRYMDDTRSYAKFCKTPTFADDVKWLVGVSVALGPMFALIFFECAARVIASPFLLLSLASESFKWFHSHHIPPLALPMRPVQMPTLKYINPSQGQIRSALLSAGYHPCSAELMESAVEMFYAAITFKTTHNRLSSNDIEEISQLAKFARDGMHWIPEIGQKVWMDFVSHIRKQKAYKNNELKQALVPVFSPHAQQQHVQRNNN